jgi:tripartite ATP-independent transporter DctM subunit
MSAATPTAPAKPNYKVLGGVGAVVAIVGIFGGILAAVIVLLALLGTPLFAILGGAAELTWLLDKDYGSIRHIAPKVLDNHFAGSPILVTIPLFTFVGYLLAEAKTAQRLVRASTAVFGWMPGGLAIVCIVASAVFTLFTGGSGVTIIAIGGLLLPALKREGYSDKFSIGAVTSGGSLGLLLPYSLPLMIYCLVAHVDFTVAFKSVLGPGVLVLVMFAAYAAYVAIQEKVPRRPFEIQNVASALWELKWELGIPLILIVGLKIDPSIDQWAAGVALYTLLIEVFAYKDLSFRKDVPRIAKASMALAGAVILILSMANALINYVIQVKIPDKILDFMVGLGLDKPWQFLLVLNLFLLVLGMLMEGFSAILVAVPLILPLAARFHLGPFHLAMIFLLNLELAYCCPPLGLNLFISSFRFNRPAVSLYRPILPFLGVLTAALLLVSYIPWISNVPIQGIIEEARAKAEKDKLPPRDAWLLECVQYDPNNPLPCTPEEQKKFPNGQAPVVENPITEDAGAPVVESEAGADDDLLQKMLGGGGGTLVEAGKSEEDDLLDKMLNAGKDSGPPDAGPKKALTPDEELLQKMLNP